MPAASIERRRFCASGISNNVLAGVVLVAALTAAGLTPAYGQDSWQDAAREAMDAADWDRAIRVLDAVVEEEPGLLRARLLRAVSRREKAVIRFDHTRNLYFLSPKDLKTTWSAAQKSARGEPWALERGRDYDVTASIFDFEYILARDSSFGNVLHEYANLWHRHHVFDRAADLAEAQVRVKPHFPEAHAELVEIYRHFIWRAGSDDAMRLMSERDTPYARYFIGEIHRRESRYDQSDRIFASVLEASSVRVQPVLMSVARMRVAQGRYEEAHAAVARAMQIATPVEGRLLLRDFSYVMDRAEYVEAKSLRTAKEYADFYARLWARRDPAPAADVNWRLVEHVRRLVTAEQKYAYFGPRRQFTTSGAPTDGGSGPTVTMFGSDYPPAYAETHGVNDKGLIFIRHGEPDEIVETQPTPNVSPNASWRYYDEGLDFHFMISNAEGTAYSWPLVSVLTNCYMADDRRHFGGLYNQIAPVPQSVDPRATGRPSDPCGPGAAPRDELDVRHGLERLATQNRELIVEGLTTDRHTWSTREVVSFDFPYDVVAFRGPDGTTDVSVYFALPVGWLSEQDDRDELPVEIGLALHDTTWRAAMVETETRRYDAVDDRTTAAFEELHVTVPPDSYRVSLHAALTGAAELGGYQFGRSIPDFSRAETMMSDVLPAYDIRPKPGHVPSVRRSLQITANPFHRFSLDQPVHVFFELYNLALDADDAARYRVEYRLEPQEAEGGILGIFRRPPPGLSVSADFEDDTPSPIVFSQIDVSELAPGEYDLLVRVTDRNGGRTMERRLPIELVDREL